jgi:regulatory protein
VDYKERKIKLSPELALEKIKSWCAYQERSQYDVRQKLYDYGVEQTASEEMIAQLITENYLNEERFAIAFAGGKFRIKQWGRTKIKAELKKHRVTDRAIGKALGTIDPDEYMQVLEKLAEKKLAQLSGTPDQKRFNTTFGYLLSRGFESDLVSDRLNELKKNKEYEFRPEE